MKFFSSDIAVAIAWICGIAGFIYGLVQKNSNNKLKVQLANHEISILNSQLHKDESHDTVAQSGEKNVYTKNNSGGMHINM